MHEQTAGRRSALTCGRDVLRACVTIPELLGLVVLTLAGSCSTDDPPTTTQSPLSRNCDVANGGCDPLVECRSDRSLTACGLCPNGYVDANGDGTRCDEVDECADGSHDCPPSARCINFAGGHLCECPPGTRNAQGSCADIDECLDNNGGCGAGIECRNSAGSYLCGNCPEGTTGDAPDCVDIDECSTGNGGCDARASCSNAANSGAPAVCGSCPMGHSGTGTTGCVDIDECATDNGGCGALPDGTPIPCANIEGAHQCGDCPTGYTGSAPSCSDIDECATNNGECGQVPDGRIIACSNTIGGYSCDPCPAGYEGVPPSCIDVDECATDNGGCGELFDGTLIGCENLLGSHRCADCPAGYAGVAPDCIDIDECATDNGGCDPLAPCANAEVPGASPICGPPRLVVDRLEPARNPAASQVLVVGRNISPESVREVRLGGVLLEPSDLQWPIDRLRYPDQFAIRVPALPVGNATLEVAGLDSSAATGFEVLERFPAGSWPPPLYVFPTAPDLVSIPVITAVPIAASMEGAPPMLFDIDEEEPPLEQQCVAEFTGVECLDYVRTSIERGPCTLLDTGRALFGTCAPPDDPVLTLFETVIDVCCDDDCLPCFDSTCAGCSFIRRFVECNPFVASWDVTRNEMEMTVIRGTDAVRYVGECDAGPGDLSEAGAARFCLRPVFKDPEGRQLVIGTEFANEAECGP